MFDFAFLVPIHQKNEYGNRYYTDLFKLFIEGPHGGLGGENLLFFEVLLRVLKP